MGEVRWRSSRSSWPGPRGRATGRTGGFGLFSRLCRGARVPLGGGRVALRVGVPLRSGGCGAPPLAARLVGTGLLGGGTLQVLRRAPGGLALSGAPVYRFLYGSLFRARLRPAYQRALRLPTFFTHAHVFNSAVGRGWRARGRAKRGLSAAGVRARMPACGPQQTRVVLFLVRVSWTGPLANGPRTQGK